MKVVSMEWCGYASRIYSWPLNNRDLNDAGALYTDYFSIFTTIP